MNRLARAWLHGLRGVGVLLAFAVITLIGFVPLLPVALVKRYARSERQRVWAARAAVTVALYWARACNAAVFQISGVRVTCRRDAADQPGGCFVLISNHQCWADALFLVYALDGHFPFPRFCMKRSLRRLPIVGLAFWALDYIFVDRHSREAVRRNPELRGRDGAAIQAACRLFCNQPITLVNYIEGTRSTEAKRRAVGSPYKTLLPPRAGGFGHAVRGFGSALDGILDLSVAYADTPAPTFWAFISGRIDHVAIHLRRLDVPPQLLGETDEAIAATRAFLAARWADKDGPISEIQSPASPKRAF